MITLRLLLLTGLSAAILSAQAPRTRIVSIRSWLGWFSAEGGGGGAVVGNRAAISTWERFALTDLNGGELQEGDLVTLQAANGQYLCAEGSGGGAVVANRGAAAAWERFVVGLLPNSSISLKAAGGQFLTTEGNGAVMANRGAVAGWETFSLQFTAPPPPTGKAEDDSTAITLNGSWSRHSDGAASGGSFVSSSTSGATATYRFTGDTVTLYRRLDADGGYLSATVDDKFVGRIDSYFPQRRWQVPAVLSNLGAGEHTLVLQVLADRPAGSSGTTTYLDALEAPAPFPPTDGQQGALSTVNGYRNQMGLAPARLAPAINLAAQGHADYLQQNTDGSHEQIPGRPGFIGIDPTDRMNYFGYSAGWAENIWAGNTLAASVDAVMSTIYHRVPVITYDAIEVGFGRNNRGNNVMKFGVRNAPARPATRLLATYPADNQTDVPNSWGGFEGPLPLPDKPRPFGYPLTLHIVQPANAATGQDRVANTATLTSQSGQDVPIYLMNAGNDTNDLVGRSDFHIVPQRPLGFGTTYTANIKGTDEKGNSFDKTWRFTTQPAAGVTFISGEPVGADYKIFYGTNGPVVGSKVEYGLTNAYGSQVAGSVVQDTLHSATIVNLAPGTYHYKITATDASGNTGSTPNATFVMPNVPTTIAGIRAFQFDSDAATIFFRPTRPVASTEVEYGRTTEYGSKEAGRADDEPGTYYVTLTKLTPRATYHYRIIAKDAQGAVVATSPNQTLVLE
jgi:uncharacterized protein YkwD